MAKVSMVKKSAHKKMATKAAKGAAVVDFQLQDDGSNKFTVLGVDAVGNTLDVSGIATLTATSDNPAVVTVDTPVGMESTVHAATGPAPAIGATANIILVATWNDASIGPFTVTWPMSITPGKVSGITVVPGPPTIA